MQIRGKHIVLIGASGGIGAAVAQALDAAGAHLLLVARDASQLRRLHNTLGGNEHQIAAVDITGADERRELLETARAFGAEVLINNAGSGQLSLLDDTDETTIERLIALNLTAPILLCKAFVPLLSQRSDAVILNVGSILGSIGFAGSTAYCASKFGLRGFTEALRRELADTSIRTIYFAPRATDTTLNSSAAQAMNKALGNAVDSPEYVATQLLKALAKPARANHFLGWPEALFVRINSLLPALVDKALRKQLATIRHHART